MGRKTFASLGRALPNRKNMVLSSQLSTNSTVEIIRDLQQIAPGNGESVWVIGGATVYTQALDAGLIDELYVTQVHSASGADVVLPFELYNWKLFVLQQRKRGIMWEVRADGGHAATADTPGTAYLILTRQ